MGKILIWDLPTRLFHWLFAGSFALGWVTAESDRWRDLHVFCGYLLLGLLVFRVVWGFMGSRYARFSSFAYSPRQALDFLKELLDLRAPRHLGHNPAGSWAIYLLLLLAGAVSLSGLFTMGGEEGHGPLAQGPLAGWLGHAAGEFMKGLHEATATLMLALVVVHLLGVAVESIVHRENLARAMIDGRKRGPAATGNDGGNSAATGIRSARPLTAALLSAALLGFGLWFFGGHVLATAERPYLPFRGKALPDHALWREECGGCHLAFHPTLLPARSWEALMAGLQDHFGENIELDPAVAAEITGFLTAHSADTRLTEAAYKIGDSIRPQDRPLQITETGYWVRKHDDIPEAVWQHRLVGARSNCGGCHLDAEAGTFEDAAMRLPGETPGGTAWKSAWANLGASIGLLQPK